MSKTPNLTPIEETVAAVKITASTVKTYIVQGWIEGNRKTLSIAEPVFRELRRQTEFQGGLANLLYTAEFASLLGVSTPRLQDILDIGIQCSAEEGQGHRFLTYNSGYCCLDDSAVFNYVLPARLTLKHEELIINRRLFRRDAIDEFVTLARDIAFDLVLGKSNRPLAQQNSHAKNLHYPLLLYVDSPTPFAIYIVRESLESGEQAAMNPIFDSLCSQASLDYCSNPKRRVITLTDGGFRYSIVLLQPKSLAEAQPRLMPGYTETEFTTYQRGLIRAIAQDLTIQSSPLFKTNQEPVWFANLAMLCTKITGAQ